MSHSHIPVQHLIKQVELYRARRVQRDKRPAWLTQTIDRVTDLFNPATDVARVGYDCQFAEDVWQLSMYLGSTEIVGGPNDGHARHTNFEFDVQGVVELFERVDRLAWIALPDKEQPSDGSVLLAQGLIGTNPLRLTIHALPPADIGPGLKQFPNGECSPA